MAKEKVEIMVDGGKAAAGPVFGQKFGPLKMDIQQILGEINKKTADFKGMKVPVTVIVDTKDKSFELEIGTPPVSELIKKEMGLDKGTGTQKIKKIGNIGIEQVIKITKMKRDSMITRDLKAAVKSVVGSCGSLGLLIESKSAKQINEEIDNGAFDSFISAGKTEISPDKKNMLKEELDRINAELEKEYSKEAVKVEETAVAAPSEDTKKDAKAEKKEEKKK